MSADPLGITHTMSAIGALQTPSRHLLVFEPGRVRHVALPGVGVFAFGRTPDVELQLEDAAVSRRHAELHIGDGVVRLVDLDSHNGTRVNGVPIRGPRELFPGDEIAIGDVVLVLNAPAPVRPARSQLSVSDLRERLHAEIERASAFGRPLACVAIAPGEAGLEALYARLLLSNVAAVHDGTLVVAMPEVPPYAVADRARDLLESTGAGARAGFSCLPTDGCDPDTLIAAAVAAARTAAPGHALAAHEAVVRRTLGDQEVLLADSAMIRVYSLLDALAASDLGVLVRGETGTGKEAAALALHAGSARARGPFRALNCAAIPDALVESELFGHERGAFSGAAAAKVGLFEAAHGGTLFLDEVGELSLGAQAKLLRALETRRFCRLGDVRERSVDLRVVAATHRDLEAAAAAGRFREDLFFRIAAATVVLPPLRERPREIPVLARRFLDQVLAAAGQPELAISPAAMQRLCTHAWPGNVRELKNVMGYVAATARGPQVEPHDLPEKLRPAGSPVAPPPPAPAAPGGRVFAPIADELRELERQRMLEALEAAGGVQTRAAALLSMPLRTFQLRFKQYGLGGKE